MCLCYHDYNHYHYNHYYHHYCCRSCCYYQYYHHHHHHVIAIIIIIITILGIFNHQCMWTFYYKIRWDFAMMCQIAAFKYIFNWYLHPGIYSSMEYSITWRHKLCRAFTLDALASRPVACMIYVVCCDDMMWCDVMWSDVMWVMWCGVVWCDVMWCDVVWCDIYMWYDMTWHDMIFDTCVWYGMVW